MARHVRRQEPDGGRRQLQHRYRRCLGICRCARVPGAYDRPGIPIRHQLSRLLDDALVKLAWCPINNWTLSWVTRGAGHRSSVACLLPVTRQTRTTENDRPRHDLSSYFVDTTLTWFMGFGAIWPGARRGREPDRSRLSFSRTAARPKK